VSTAASTLYREELDALIETMREAIRHPPADLNEMGKIAQFHLLAKLTRMRDIAQSMMAS